MALIKEIDRLVMLMEEIAILKSRLQPHDTGHIHTTISTLESRVEEIRNNLAETGETKW
jgi:hypothetical protein|tara:strand:- start:383 stop:559 length:177 start_codon:yes stop_codon:yes gene_type:complete